MPIVSYKDNTLQFLYELTGAAQLVAHLIFLISRRCLMIILNRLFSLFSFYEDNNIDDNNNKIDNNDNNNNDNNNNVNNNNIDDDDSNNNN